MPYTFPLEKQKQNRWCWAAVAVGVDRYFDSTSQRNQCTVANRVLGRDCCNNPAPCNQGATLTAALEAVNRASRRVPRALSFEETTRELDEDRPVCVRIGWFDGGGHFVVLSGYRESGGGILQVQVSDPWYPNSTVEYDEFRTNYYELGQWTDTYLFAE